MKTITTFMMMLVCATLFGQTHIVTWFDSDWKKVESKEQAAYYRVSIQDAKTNLFIIEDRYSTGELFRTGSYISINPEIRDGKFVWYFKNGRKQKEMLYEKNSPIDWTVWNEKKKVQLSVVLTYKGLNGEDLYEAFKVDKAPEFKGGEKAMKSYIEKNFVYPPSSRVEPIEGIAVVLVNVNPDGKLSDAKIMRKVHPDIDAEAIKLVSNMPDWTPGSVEGKAVAIPYAIPIRIRNKSSLEFSRTRTSSPNL